MPKIEFYVTDDEYKIYKSSQWNFSVHDECVDSIKQIINSKRVRNKRIRKKPLKGNYIKKRILTFMKNKEDSVHISDFDCLKFTKHQKFKALKELIESGSIKKSSHGYYEYVKT